ncbi:hypothetical protein B0H16DRAFT_647953 [Mycena metata]|uniref:Uncharacterized protein n=1 Tax=Mycena metata TaxID=1033252 RepID=A0AAD7MC04_9AGAR|nr:hypothetical protein B0H16DRAFT_647953 [Mycena metata]
MLRLKQSCSSLLLPLSLCSWDVINEKEKDQASWYTAIADRPLQFPEHNKPAAVLATISPTPLALPRYADSIAPNSPCDFASFVNLSPPSRTKVGQTQASADFESCNSSDTPWKPSHTL